MRSLPKMSPPIIEVKNPEELVTEEREYKLITPLYGGGVTPNKADPITLIRGTSIRGHLRFWWRACQGGEFKTLIEMKKREDEIWGAANTNKNVEKVKIKEQKERVTNLTKSPSLKVQIVIKKVTSQGDEVKPFEIIKNPNNSAPKIDEKKGVAPPYAAFPLRPEQKGLKLDTPTYSVRNNVSFILKISFPKTLEKEIKAALWAWETFGGLGARTRRGFGAISLISINQKAIELTSIDNIKSAIERDLKIYVTSSNNWPKDLPHLIQKPSIKVLDKAFNTSINAWEHLINKLKIFRQQRDPGVKTPGRSRWPEPDAIRVLTNQHIPAHKPNHELTAPPGEFPRAAFGLPIIFHFKDSNGTNNKNVDPSDTMLILRNSDRLASPLILRPLQCKDNKFAAVALILEGTQEPLNNQVILKTSQGKQEEWQVSTKLNEEKASKITKPDGKTPILGKQTDILKAFLNSLAY